MVEHGHTKITLPLHPPSIVALFDSAINEYSETSIKGTPN